MPVNAGIHYQKAEQEFHEANTIPEKIMALQKMLATVPKHKSSENLQMELRSKLAKYKQLLEKERKTKTGKRSTGIKKDGAATVCLTGLTNSGKSYILKKLTDAKPKIADYEFTTKQPEVGMLDYHGIKLQVIEIPAIVRDYNETENGSMFLGIIRNADLIIFVIDISKPDYREQLKLLKDELNKNEISNKIIVIGNKSNIPNSKFLSVDKLEDENVNELKDEIWNNLNLIKVYTKQPGKKPSYPPLALKKDSAIKDLATFIHKDFIKNFRFARIWGKSAKHPSQGVGINHLLMDDDVVELHMR